MKPRGFHLTHHLTCNLPFPNTSFPIPLCFFQEHVLPSTQTHLTHYICVIVCLLLLEFNCTESSVLLITKLDIARPCSINFLLNVRIYYSPNGYMKEQMGLESGKLGGGLSEPSHHESTAISVVCIPSSQDDEKRQLGVWLYGLVRLIRG